LTHILFPPLSRGDDQRGVASTSKPRGTASGGGSGSTQRHKVSSFVVCLHGCLIVVLKGTFSRLEPFATLWVLHEWRKVREKRRNAGGLKFHERSWWLASSKRRVISKTEHEQRAEEWNVVVAENWRPTVSS